MDSIRKQAGYLEGLLDAMKLDENDPESQLKRGMVALLSELAKRADAADEMLGELNDYVESIDDDLTELEGMHDELEMDMEYWPADEGEGGEPLRLIKNDDSAPRKVLLAVGCPKCSGVFLIPGAPGDTKYVCPLCGKKVRPQRLTEKNTPVGEPADE